MGSVHSSALHAPARCLSSIFYRHPLTLPWSSLPPSLPAPPQTLGEQGDVDAAQAAAAQAEALKAQRVAFEKAAVQRANLRAGRGLVNQQARGRGGGGGGPAAQRLAEASMPCGALAGLLTAGCPTTISGLCV